MAGPVQTSSLNANMHVGRVREEPLGIGFSEIFHLEQFLEVRGRDGMGYILVDR